jgi:carbon monoxide dehydrogenase subunit G
LKFEGARELRAPREKVWALIRDPNNLTKALGDARDVVVVSPTVFTANVKAGVSVIRGTFRFRFEVVDEAPPSRLSVRARGAGIGSAVDLDLGLRLEPDGTGTRLAWTADAQVSGALAGIAQRLLDQAAQKTIQDVFANIERLAEN